MGALRSNSRGNHGRQRQQFVGLSAAARTTLLLPHAAVAGVDGEDDDARCPTDMRHSSGSGSGTNAAVAGLEVAIM